MSDKWEVVGKSKPSKGSPKGKSSNGVKKSAPKPLPKLEDVLPAGSLQSMYTDYEPEPVKNEKKPDPKPSKAAAKKAPKKEPVPPKPKTPANLQEAVKMNLRVDDIKHLIESCQNKFPDSPLLWLRDLASYLNLKLVNDEKLDVGIFEGAPLSALTPNMKKAIYAMVTDIPDSMKFTYLETTIANTAHDLAKNLDVAGWMVMTQVLTDVKPCLAITNTARLVELRNSYQNRPNIGLAILWSVGQAGKKDLHVGIKIWLEIMLPLLSMKHYTKFVVEYISTLLSTHAVTENTVLSKPVMDLNNFVTVQDTVFQVSNQINKDLGRQLRETYPRLRAAALTGYNNHEILPTIMDKMKHQNMPEQVLDSLDIMARSLLGSPAALVHWHKLYTSHLNQSGQLLQYVDTHWNTFKAVANPQFEDTIQAFQDYNLTATHRDDVGLCRDGCLALLNRVSKRKGAWFPWKTISFLLLIGTAAIINLDVQKNGNFKNSHTGHFLKDVGQYDRVVDLSGRGVWVYEQGSSWAHTNLPLYYAQAREVVGPTLDTVADNLQAGSSLLLLKGGEAYNVMSTKGGEAYTVLQVKGGELASVLREGVTSLQDQYPGVKQQAGLYLTSAQDGLRSLANRVVVFYQELVDGKVDWNQIKDNIGEKIEATRGYLAQGAQWARQQVDQLIK